MEALNARKKWTEEDKQKLMRIWNQCKLQKDPFNKFTTLAMCDLAREKSGICYQVCKTKIGNLKYKSDDALISEAEYLYNKELSSVIDIKNAISEELNNIFNFTKIVNPGQLSVVSAPTGTGKSHAIRKQLKSVFMDLDHVKKGGSERYYIILPTYRLMHEFVNMLKEDNLPFVIITGQNKMHRDQFDRSTSIAIDKCPGFSCNNTAIKDFKKKLDVEIIEEIPKEFKIECDFLNKKDNPLRMGCRNCHYKYPMEVVKQFKNEKKPIIILTTLYKMFYQMNDFEENYQFNINGDIPWPFKNSTFILDESTEAYMLVSKAKLEHLNIFDLLNNIKTWISDENFEIEIKKHVLNTLEHEKNKYPKFIHEYSQIEKSIIDLINNLKNVYQNEVSNFYPLSDVSQLESNYTSPMLLDKAIEILGSENDQFLPLNTDILSSTNIPFLNDTTMVDLYLSGGKKYTLISHANKQFLSKNGYDLACKNINLNSLINYIWFIFVKLNNQFNYFYGNLNNLAKTLDLKNKNITIQDELSNSIKSLQYKVFNIEARDEGIINDEVENQFLLAYTLISILNKQSNKAIPYLTEQQAQLEHGLNYRVISDKPGKPLSNLHIKNVYQTCSRYEVMPLLKAMRSHVLKNNLYLCSANANIDSIAVNPDLNYLSADEFPPIFDSVNSILESNRNLSKDEKKNFDIGLLQSKIFQNDGTKNLNSIANEIIQLTQNNKPLLGVIYLNSHTDVDTLLNILKEKKQHRRDVTFLKIREGAKAQRDFNEKAKKFILELEKSIDSVAPKLLILTTYATLSTGINLTLEIPSGLYKQALLTKNTWLFEYCQKDITPPVDDNTIMSFDINCYINCCSKSYASGEIEESLILHLFDQAIDDGVIKKYEKISDKTQVMKYLKYKYTNNMCMLVSLFQSLGRCNRSFYNPETTMIRFSNDTPNMFKEIGETIWNSIAKTKMYEEIIRLVEAPHQDIIKTTANDGSDLLNIFYTAQNTNNALIRTVPGCWDLVEKLKILLVELYYCYYKNSNTLHLEHKHHFSKNRTNTIIKKEIEDTCKQLNKMAQKNGLSASLQLNDFVVTDIKLAKLEILYVNKHGTNITLSNVALFKDSQRYFNPISNHVKEFIHPGVLLKLVYSKITEETGEIKILKDPSYQKLNVNIGLTELADSYLLEMANQWPIAIDYKTYSWNNAIDKLSLSNINEIFTNFNYLTSKISTIQQDNEIATKYNGNLCYVLCIDNQKVYPTQQMYAQVFDVNNHKIWVSLEYAKSKKMIVLSLLIVLNNEKLKKVKDIINYALRSKI